MSVIHVDFRKRLVSTGPVGSAIEHRDFEPVRTSDPIGHWKYMVRCIEARFGDKPPKSGFVYKQKLNTAIFDSYGYGCIHNSIHQYRGGKYWNEPMPMPADLELIEKYLERMSGKVLRLGYKSDPFMWMDMKYKITKSIIEMANSNNITLMIDTMSDLCGHDDYLALLRGHDHMISMHMGFKRPELATDQIERLVSPGAPSFKRREQALSRLANAGIEVRRIYTSISEILNDPKKLRRFNQCTGMNANKQNIDEVLKNLSEKKLTGY